MTLSSISRILVPVDGSEDSKRALEFAVGMAKALNAKVTALHVVKQPTAAYPFDISLSAQVIESAEEYGKQLLDDLKKGVSETLDLKTEMRTAYDVARKIVEVGREGGYDLIVMGTRGLSGVKRILLGSVASGVVAHASCTVVIVR